MNRRSVLSISAIMMLGLTALPNSAISQQWSIKDQLVGTWTLASWEHVLPNGSKDQSYGTNPKGIVVFDAKGRFFLMFARPDLPKIASNAPATATSEEAKDLLSGSIAYFGTYGVNDADKVINLRLEASTFPNQLASDQNGTITSLTADELHYEMTALAGGKTPRQKLPEISSIFKAGKVTLLISREKDRKLRLVHAGIGHCQGGTGWRGARAAVPRRYV